MKVEIHRSEAERSLLQGEISLMHEGRRIEGRDLEWEMKIGVGGQGEVWRGVWRMLPNQYVAIKKMKNFNSRHLCILEILRELISQTQIFS